MRIVSVFYAAFGYLALLGAILGGMLFVGDGVAFLNMDAAAAAVPLGGAFVDLGLLLLLALLHGAVSRGMLRRFGERFIPVGLERSTQAWAAAMVLAVIYMGWQPLPQILWAATGALAWVLSGFFYLAWTLILIGAFLSSHVDLFEITEATAAAPPAAANDGALTRAAGKLNFTDTLRQPLYYGILVAVWAGGVMTVGHLLLASAVTAYLAFDGLWAAHKAGSMPWPHSRASASRVSA